MAKQRCVRSPSIRTLPAESAGDVLVHGAFLHRPLAPACAEELLLGSAPWCQSSCYQFRLVPRAAETWPVSKGIPSPRESAAVQGSPLRALGMSWKEKDSKEWKPVFLHLVLMLKPDCQQLVTRMFSRVTYSCWAFPT